MGRHKLSDERLLGTEVPLDFSTYMQFTDFPIYTFIRWVLALPLSLSEETVMRAYFCKKAQACSGLLAYAAANTRLTPIPFDILVYE